MYNINLDYRFSFRNEKKKKEKREFPRNGKAERFSRDFFLLASTVARTVRYSTGSQGNWFAYVGVSRG